MRFKAKVNSTEIGTNPKSEGLSRIHAVRISRSTASLRLSVSQATHSQTIQRAFHPRTALPQHVSVDHRRGHVIVAKQLLDGADIGAALQRVGCETVAKGGARLPAPDPGA